MNEDVFPIERGDFPVSQVEKRYVFINHFHTLLEN